MFKSSKEYKKEVDKLRKRNPKRAREFDKSWKQFLNDMSKEYGRKHPKEYPVCPTHLKEIIKSVGFSKSRVIKSPLPHIAVVGTK